MTGGGEDSRPLEYTPTWVVATVCSVIIGFSLAAERILHIIGKILKKKNLKTLFEALQKAKEELMLLGFISLLLNVFQGPISHICMPVDLTKHLFPCEKVTRNAKQTTGHFVYSGVFGSGKRHLAEEQIQGHCKEGKVPLLSTEALHQLHIFIFVLAVVHVVFCILTLCLAGAKIQQWKWWEASIAKDNYETDKVLQREITHVHQHPFIKDHFLGFGKGSTIRGWLHAFAKQFYGSVTKTDYAALRLGFIMTHCRGNPKFNFYMYMMRTLQEDFKKVVGISWYLWIIVILLLLLNVNGWNTYFWMAFIPLILLFVVGTKLEHVITQLARDVAKRHTAVVGELVVQPSDVHFWFGKPKIVLLLIHFILFQNAFEMAFFFWILTAYGWNSCIMGQTGYIIPRIVIGVTVQLLCCYSTLPLYAIVTQMGSSFKKAMFDEHVQETLINWAQQAKKKRASKATSGAEASTPTGDMSAPDIMLQEVGKEDSGIEVETNAPLPAGPPLSSSEV